jgi:endonuclease I
MIHVKHPLFQSTELYPTGKYLTIILLLNCLFVNAQIPSGYYNTATGSSAALKTQLYNIIKNHTARTYDNLWTDFQSTDRKSNGKVWDMYSDIPGGTPPYEFTFITEQCGTYAVEGDCYNREHSFPKSWFGISSGQENSVPMGTDLFHLYPTDGKVNGMRSDYPFGEVGVATFTSQNGSKLGNCTYPGYTGIVFEPIDAYKGDFARSYFYMATRYENIIAGWYSNSTEANAILQNNNFPVFESWFLQMLGEWHVADPVSQKEIDRNNAVYAIQGNRNPFIDHPEYVNAIWGVGQSAGTEPTAYPTQFSARNIHLQWTDASGAVVPDNYLIRMSTVSFADIAVPQDGTFYPDSNTDKNIAAGVQEVWFKNLQASTTYYFKIFGYVGSGSSCDYKTDGVIPQVSKATN